MKLAIFILASCPLWALSNAVTIQEKSGTTQTNRVLTIPRYFAQDEICQYPRPYNDLTSAFVTNWQVDIKTRWPVDSICSGGAAKYALITIEITLAASSTNNVIEFQNSSSSSSGGSALTQSQMLNFNTGSGAGSWGAGWSATTGGVTESCLIASTVPCDARAMIGAGMWKYLEQGPLRTSVLVREASDDQNGDTARTTSLGWQCTARLHRSVLRRYVELRALASTTRCGPPTLSRSTRRLAAAPTTSKPTTSSTTAGWIGRRISGWSRL